MADYPGPLSADEIARATAYYGGAGLSSSASAPAPVPPAAAADYYGPPPPAVRDLGELDAPPPPPVRDLGEIDPPRRSLFGGPLGLSEPSAPAAPTTGAPALSAAEMGIGADKLVAADLKAGTPAPKGITAVVNTGGAAPKDDREFAAFRKLQDTAKKPAAKGGGGAGNPDPYGVKDAQGKLLGSYDAEAAAVRAGANAEGERSNMLAEGHSALAQLQQKDALIHERELNDAQRGFDEHMGEIQRQVDEVRAKKIDPHRLMRGDGMAITAALGGLLGGFYMGMNKLDHNPFLDDLNKGIDRDIAAQERDLDNERAGVANKMSVLKEQRATFKDNDLAKLQTKALMYAAAEESLKAEGAKYDDPISKARTEQGVIGIQREGAKLGLAIKEAAMRQSQQAAAARAAQDRAQQLEMRKAYGDTYEKVIAKTGNAAQAEFEANRMVQNLFAGGAGERPPAAPGAAGTDPVSMVPEKQQEAAIKEREAYAKAETGASHIAKLYKGFDATSFTSPRQLEVYRAGIASAVKAGAGPGMSSDNDYKNFIEPNLPNTTDTAETLRVKQAALIDAIHSSVATPTLDQHAPGWRGPAPVKQYTPDGKPR